MAEGEPRISVITPVRDGAEAIPALFDALAAQTVAPERFEVVVIDNASRDATARVARERGAVVVTEPVPGRARARNRGVAVARGALLAFTDADCLPRTDWLEQLEAGLARHAVVGGPVVLTLSGQPTPVERLDKLWRFRQRESVEERGWAATANVGMRREVFDAI